MIIKCDKCLKSFKLPDEKVKPDGTKVRCSKCKNVFTVFPLKEEREEIQEFEEKTRIAFIHTPFGDEQDDDSPVNIKRHKDGDSKITSFDSIGHGIPLSSPEIKAIQDTEMDLSDIMSTINTALENLSPHIQQEQESKPLKQESDTIQQTEEKAETDNSPPSETTTDSLDMLFAQIGDLADSQKKEEGTSDLSTLLPPLPEEDKNNQIPNNNIQGLPELNEILTSVKKEGSAKEIPQTSPSPVESSPISEQDKLSMDIDSVFDSLFSETTQPEQKPSQKEAKVRKTMSYMEAVPVAPSSHPEHSNTEHLDSNVSMQIDSLETLSKEPAEALQPQIQDNLLSDDLSLFNKEPIKTQSTAPSSGMPTLNWGDDLLQEIMVSAPTQKEAPPAFDSSNIAFGEIGSDILATPQQEEAGRFAPNANRSDDLLSQMDSIDTAPPMPVSSPLPQTDRADIRKPEIGDKVKLFTEDEAKKDNEKKRTAVPPSIKPATIAIKDSQKSKRSEILKWIFTVLFSSIVLFISLFPQTTFPNIKTGIFSILDHSFLERAVTIDNLYYNQINDSEILLVFIGTVNLRKAATPDSIRLVFKIQELSGVDIIQIESPITYSEDFDSIMEISSNEEIKDFIKKNSMRMFTQRKNRFTVPLIIKNIDISSIDLKVGLKENSQ